MSQRMDALASGSRGGGSRRPEGSRPSSPYSGSLSGTAPYCETVNLVGQKKKKKKKKKKKNYAYVVRR